VKSKLAEGFIVIEQANVHGREVAVFQDFLEFLAFERGCADDGHAIEVLRISLHLGSGASS
jgi:hypothetical protein